MDLIDRPVAVNSNGSFIICTFVENNCEMQSCHGIKRMKWRYLAKKVGGK